MIFRNSFYSGVLKLSRRHTIKCKQFQYAATIFYLNKKKLKLQELVNSGDSYIMLRVSKYMWLGFCLFFNAFLFIFRFLLRSRTSEEWFANHSLRNHVLLYYVFFFVKQCKILPAEQKYIIAH